MALKSSPRGWLPRRPVGALDGQAVAEALGRVLSDSEARVRMGREGRRLIERHFTWPRIADRSLEIYACILTGRPPSE